MRDVKITACVIAKNEEKNIARCLSSVKPIASELIVVDTGSTDNTVSIAKKLGASVYFFQWIDDFAAAKNYALEKANGDWIVFLDADEYLEESCVAKVKDIIARIGNAEIDGILGTLINVDGDKSKVQTTIPSLRIFRNHPDLKYEGAIHESLKHRKRAMRLFDGCRDIIIMHLGYSKSEIARKDKGRRNLTLLLKELGKKPDDASLHFYLAETYSLMDEHELALYYALRVHSYAMKQAKFMPMMEKNYFNIINYMRSLNFPNAKIAEVIKEANKRFPNNPDFYVYMGDLFRHQKQSKDAITMYEKALSLLESAELSRVEIKTPSALQPIYKGLADLYYAVHDLPKTVRLLTEILKADRYDFAALCDLMNILLQARTSEPELISFLDKIYNKKETKDLIFLLKAALRNASRTLTQHYMSALVSHSVHLPKETLELALLEGEYASAAEGFVQLHEQEPDNSRLLVKAVVSALLAEDAGLERKVLSYAARRTGLPLVQLIRGCNGEVLKQEELEFLLEMIQEFRWLGRFEPIRMLLQSKHGKQLILPAAKLFYHHRNYEEALFLFEEYLKQNLEIEEAALADVLVMMADALLQLNETEAARQYIEEAYALVDQDFRIYDIWIQIALASGDAELLQEVAKKAIAAFPDSVYVASLLGNAVAGQTDIDDDEHSDRLVELLHSFEYRRNLYARAVKLTEEGRDEEAVFLFDFLKEFKDSAGVAYFRLGEIANRAGKVMKAKTYHTKAFEADPKLAQKLLKEDHPVYHYEYKPVEDEITVVHCPLCQRRGVPYSCYNAITSIDFLTGFNPIRVWMYCENCHHLFAHNYPRNLGEILANSAFEFNMKVKTQWLPIIGGTIADLKKKAPGNRLLEVGVGSGEMTAVAKEYLFDVTGVDIRPAYAENISRMLNVPIYSVDFLLFESEQPFDVICMGNVIEHMANPVVAIKKASQLLNDKGILWISTPNFESAFSMVMKDRDPMWRIIEHLNYFSFRSLKAILEANHFEVIDYKISARYNGSMEVTAIKK